MIELRGVEKSYPQGGGQVFVLRRVDLKVDEGDFVSIMGPSGAGKSTLLHILGLHDSDFTGEFHLVGEPVHKLGRKQRHELQKRAIGFVFQSYHLLDELTVAENLELPLSYRNLKKSEREAIVADTLDRFQIVGKKDLYPRQLSGGQQQLVAVARAIVASPKLILADEPTGNLHSEQGRRDHAAVPEAERRGHHDHPGHALGDERGLRPPHREDARRLDRERAERCEALAKPR